MSGFEGRRGRVSRIACRLALGAGCLALANCANSNNVASRVDGERDVAAETGTPKQAAVKPAPKPKIARESAHKSAQRRVAQEGISYSAVGTASWYGADFHGRRTANGETFNMHSLTAAHRTLPLQCTVRVTNLANNRSLMVRVNDRGPYAGNRLIDLSARSAKLLGFYDRGLAKVKVDYIGRAPSPAAAKRITASAAPL